LNAPETASREPDREHAGADLVGRHRNLGRRTVLVSALTLVSRVLGYAREIVSAALFGDRSPVFDAFITAWRIPNLFRRFLGEGALSTSFQTALTETEGRYGTAAGARLFRETFRLLFWVLIGVCAVVTGVVALLPDVMPITGWHWLGADPEPVRDLTVRVMPFVVFICLSALVGGALNVRGHFSTPAVAPAALNTVWVLALLVIAWHFGWRDEGGALRGEARHLAMAHWLAWGVLAAGVVQLLVQVPALVRQGFFHQPRPGGAVRPDGAARPLDVLKRSAPLALGAAVYQINVMIDGLMAEGLLPDGGPTLHYYANRVQQFPLALIAIAATSAVFPALQAYGHKGERRAVRDLHDRTHRAICFVALPATAGLFALAGPVIAVSFEHGAFGPEGVRRATACLQMLTLAILPAGAVGLVARTFYALGDFVTPVRVSMVMLVLNVGLNLVCIQVFGMDVDGLALATAVTSWASLAALLARMPRKLDLPASDLPFLRPVGKMLVAAIGAGLLAAGMHWSLARYPVLALVAGIAAGMLGYVLLARRLGVPEARGPFRRLRRGPGAE